MSDPNLMTNKDRDGDEWFWMVFSDEEGSRIDPSVAEMEGARDE